MKVSLVMVLIASALLIISSVSAVGATEMRVEAPTMPVSVGETIVVPVTVTGADRLDAFDVSVTVDASHVTIAANSTNPMNEAILTVNTLDNTVKVSFYTVTAGVIGDTTLFYVDCTPKTSGAATPVNLTIESVAENGSAGTPGDDVFKRYTTVNGTITTKKDAPTVTAVEVAPAQVSALVPGETQQFAATISDQYGSAMKTPVTWTSSNTTVGTIDTTTGIFTAAAAGTTGVTAQAGGVVSGAVTVTVKTSPAPEKIEVLPKTLTSSLNKTETQQFSATVYDQYGSVMEAPVIWTSSDTVVGSIDRVTGLFTAKNGGTTMVTASAGSATSEGVIVTVCPAAVTVPPSPVNPVISRLESDSPETVRMIIVDREDLDGDGRFSIAVVAPTEGSIPTFAAGMGRPADALLTLNITPENLKDEKNLRYSAVLTVGVPTSKISEDDKFNVRAYRYNTGTRAWEALPTTWQKTEAGYHHYEVKTPGFSIFTMVRTTGGATPPAPPPPSPSSSYDSSGGGGGGGGGGEVKVVDTPTADPTPTPAATTATPGVTETVVPPTGTGTATTPAPTEPVESPGFGLAVTLVGAAAAAGLAGRRE